MSQETVYLTIYIVILLIGRFVSQSQRKSKNASLQPKNIIKDTTALIMGVSVLIAFSTPLIEALLRASLDLSTVSIVIGILLMIMGWSVAYSANHTIAENWSPVIDKTQEQMLVTSGLYSVIRHPLYLSGILILIGTNVYFENVWAWAGTALVFAVTLYRIPREDQQLEARFGQEYIAYKQRTKAIIPLLL